MSKGFGKTVETLGDYLREQRVANRLSLRQLADAAGVSNPYLSQIERGLRRPSAEVLQSIAKALRISAETLYVQAGILSPDDIEVRSVELAVLADTGLTDRQKQALIDVYTSFRTANNHPTASAPDTTTVSGPTPTPAEGAHHAHHAHHAHKTDRNFAVTTPFYAYVGVAELAVERVRKTADDLQAQLDEARTRLADLDRDPKALAEQARAQVTSGLETATKETNKRIDVLQKETNKRITAFQTQANKRVDAFQGDLRQLPKQAQDELRALPARVEARFEELQADLKALYAKVEAQLTAQLSELATRGESRIAKLRDDSISGDVEILREDTEVVMEVGADIEAAAADAAAEAKVAAVKPARKAPAKKAPTRKTAKKA